MDNPFTVEVQKDALYTLCNISLKAPSELQLQHIYVDNITSYLIRI